MIGRRPFLGYKSKMDALLSEIYWVLVRIVAILDMLLLIGHQFKLFLKFVNNGTKSNTVI